MIVEQIYLENKTTRKAFYLIKLIRNETQNRLIYEVEVQSGRIGTNGRTITKMKSINIESARLEMHELAELKKLRYYHEIHGPKMIKIHSENGTEMSTSTSSFAERFLSLELE